MGRHPSPRWDEVSALLSVKAFLQPLASRASAPEFHILQLTGVSFSLHFWVLVLLCSLSSLKCPRKLIDCLFVEVVLHLSTERPLHVRAETKVDFFITLMGMH